LPGSWAHLARRFFWSLHVLPLTSGEIVEVESILDGSAAGVFFEQSAADQRHGLDSARHVASAGASPELIRAALMHDIGKRHARLGVLGRTIASVCQRMGIPVTGRLGVYLDHPRLGAAELEALGFGALVVGYTRSHHDGRPTTIPEADWDLLTAADTVVGRKRVGR
jgi:hypothetical protein